MQQPRERALIVRMFVNVWNTQLWFPEKRMICPFEHLALLGDGFDCRLKRRTAIRIAEGSAVDVIYNQLDTAPDGSEVLQPLGPKKPSVVGTVWVASPALNNYLSRCGSRVVVEVAQSILLRINAKPDVQLSIRQLTRMSSVQLVPFAGLC